MPPLSSPAPGGALTRRESETKLTVTDKETTVRTRPLRIRSVGLDLPRLVAPIRRARSRTVVQTPQFPPPLPPRFGTVHAAIPASGRRREKHQSTELALLPMRAFNVGAEEKRRWNGSLQALLKEHLASLQNTASASLACNISPALKRKKTNETDVTKAVGFAPRWCCVRLSAAGSCIIR